MLKLAIAIAALSITETAGAVTMRYALIVGNNEGVDSDGSRPFQPLKHAEREAADLKTNLVGLANFDASRRRTRLLTGATLSQVKAAFKTLKRQKERDEKFFKSMESIFLFYFTGHGLEGRILLKDGAVKSDTLAELFNTIDADLSVGVFDACHSGSLDGVLSEKGIRAMPGFNIIRTLPNEVLSAKGSIWFVSSQSGQMSYEDKAIGGVFTHFFIEALKSAPREGPGIPLESIWQYARRKTVSYTAARNRVQVPEQMISSLRSSAPVYFSFPVPRSATLVLTEGFSGRFALEYADGHLTEVFEKKKGTRHEVGIYPGRARLVLIEETSDVMVDKVFEISSGGTLILQGMPEAPVRPSVGERAAPLFPKGVAIRDRLTATKVEPRFSLIGGVGYAFSYTDKYQIHPRHRVAIPFRFDFKRAMLGIALNLGLDRRQYDWAYRAFMVGGRIRGGFCLDVEAVRLTVFLGFSFGHIAQQYQEPNIDKTAWELYPTGGISAVFPRKSRALGEVFAFIGPLFSTGSGIDGTMGLQTAGGVGATFYLRLI